MSFTREELSDMYKEQLVRLAGYYGIELNMRLLKGDMIDRILEETSSVVEADMPQASVRIQRIRESQEK
jgi:hypothetical protein